MLKVTWILAYVVLFSTLVPVAVLVSKRKYLNSTYKAVFLLLIALLIGDSISYLTNQYFGENLWSSHIYMILERVPVFWFFHVVYKSPRFSRFLGFAALVYLVLHLVDIFYTAGIYNYNWLSRAYTSALFTYCGMNYLMRLYRAPSTYHMAAQPLYWFCLAIALAAGGVFMLDIAQKLFDPALEKNWPYLLYIHFIRLCLLILSRILFTIGVFKIPSNRMI